MPNIMDPVCTEIKADFLWYKIQSLKTVIIITKNNKSLLVFKLYVKML